MKIRLAFFVNILLYESWKRVLDVGIRIIFFLYNIVRGSAFVVYDSIVFFWQELREEIIAPIFDKGIS